MINTFVYFCGSKAGGEKETDQTVKWLKLTLKKKKKSNDNIIPGNCQDIETQSAAIPMAMLASCQQPEGQSYSVCIFT